MKRFISSNMKLTKISVLRRFIKSDSTDIGMPVHPNGSTRAKVAAFGETCTFGEKRAIDAYASRVDRELQECVEAGRELGAKIALPIWENVWKTSIQEEMGRVCGASEWTRPEQTMRKSAYNPLSFDDVLAFYVSEALEHCEVQDLLARQEGRRARRPTLRQIVLDQLQSAGREGSKAAPIRIHAKQVLERDFHAKAVGMTLNRLAKAGAGAPERPPLVPCGAKLRGEGRPGGRANTLIVD